VTQSHSEENSSYHSQNLKSGNPVGLVRMRPKYQSKLGEEIRWLFISIEELRQYAHEAGIQSVEILAKDEENYLAKLVV